MKKILILLLISCISTSLTAQTAADYNIKIRDTYHGKGGKPTFIPATTNAIAADSILKKSWRYKGGSSGWVEIPAASAMNPFKVGGLNGKDAVVSVKSVSTTTTAPGTNANVVITDSNTDPSVAELNFGISIPQGQKGDKGDPGTGGGGSVTLPFNIVIDNGTDNRAQLQAAIDNSYITGKQIWILGLRFPMSGGVIVPKNMPYLYIDGTAKLVAINSNTFTFISSPVPINRADAEDVYTNRKIVIQNIGFEGINDMQTGIDLMCTEGAIYYNIEGKNLKLIINNTFGLRSDIRNIEGIHCYDGVKVQSGIGRYPDATIENAAPNGTVITNFRWVADATSNVAVLIKDCSGCKIDYITIEGDKSNIGVDWDCTSPSATGALIDIIHYEGAQPCGIALIRIKSSTMFHTISNLNTIKPSIYVEVIPLSSGNPDVEINTSSNQRVLFTGTPVFKTQKGVMWTFNRTDNPLTDRWYQNDRWWAYTDLFTGAPMQLVCGRESLAGVNSGLCILRNPK